VQDAILFDVFWEEKFRAGNNGKGFLDKFPVDVTDWLGALAIR
jgi:hypothetical protein